MWGGGGFCLMRGLPFSVSGWKGSLPVGKTLVLLLLKQTFYITKVLTSHERWNIMLFSHSALIPQLCLHFFQKLKYYTLGNKDYSAKLFWVAVAINVNAGVVKGTVSPLVKTRNKTLMGSMDKSVETMPIRGFLWMHWEG